MFIKGSAGSFWFNQLFVKHKVWLFKKEGYGLYFTKGGL
ncbi:hypothetical protein BH09BAC4_BH09BAC4_49580 [soil metagenome]